MDVLKQHPRTRVVAPFALAATVAFAILALPARGASPIDSDVRPFLKQYCAKCHGDELQKGKLRMDTLAAPDADSSKTWSKIVDALDMRDMPPTKASQPTDADRLKVVRLIGEALAKAAPARSTGLRRMNRVEYENTVHDLLGIDTPLAELLPEDGAVQGFDNVAGGLAISPVLMERYLEAADAAFDGVIRRIKPLPAETRRVDMMQVKENVESVKQHRAGVIEVENSFVKFTPGWPPVRLDSIHPIEDGVYRCRIGVWPYEPGGRTLEVAVYVGPLFGPGKRRFMGMFDVTGTPEKPRVIEFTTFMKENDALHIVPWVYPEHVTWRDKDKEARPGIAVAWAETHGPLDQSWPSVAQKKLMGDLPMVEGDPIWMRHRKGVRLQSVDSPHPKEDAARIIRAFVPRAFRRPVDDATVEKYVKLALDRLDAGRTFEQAVRAGIDAVLCSPGFLLINDDPSMDDYTLASRLSYFLWSSMPDDELMKLAAEGKLRDPKVRYAQVERMLGDPRSEQFVLHFTGQWLSLRSIEFTTPDQKLYPEFDELLQQSMLGETRGFFSHILKNDLSVLNFIDSDFTVLNERLALHYGIPGIKGHEQFRVVELPKESIRGGVLTQASILKVTANGTSTSPVLRGVWVLDHLLCQPPSPPPPGVPAVEPDIRGATTIREQLDKHRAIESCARCHARIDPPGFALESFDPIGGQRDRYRSLGEGERVKDVNYRLALPVQTNGQLPTGESFDDFRAFRKLLLANRDTVVRGIAQKLLVYGTGRPITPADRPVIDAVVEAAAKKDDGLRSMIHAVVDSEMFVRP